MSDVTYRIHPAIGFARVGDAPDAYYLEPTAVGGLPTERDEHGVEHPVTEYKHAGQVKRQAARFRVYRHEDGRPPVEVSAGDGLTSVTWSVHVANKKAAWFNFAELQGNVMLGEDNTYEQQGVPLRNPAVEDRQQLITDPGPRTLTAPGDWVELDAASAPADYRHVSFPPATLTPYPVTTLGRVRMTEQGELLVLGGLGNAGGPPGSIISGFAGADGWYDDVGDGPVRAEIVVDGEKHVLDAWVVTGAPKLAPELVNVTSLADTFIDVGVRYMNLCPALYADGEWQDYEACLERDVLPIFHAMKEYRWVANVDAMVSVATPPFDLRDLRDDEDHLAMRQAIFRKFRDPGKGNPSPELASQHQQLFDDDGFPLMPLNSGDNSISNALIEKFMAVTPTQYHLLRQWANGRCVSMADHPGAGRDWAWVSPLDLAGSGNAVGEPMAPGIEVTWTMRNPDILTPGDPFRVLREDEDYGASGLSPMRDETLTGGGCQPGDLTKRMATPWQADFFQCSEQNVNFTTPSANKTISGAGRIPLAPTFFAYWWPAQSPYNVYEGARTAMEQGLEGNAYLGNNNFGQTLGQNVLYHRGLNSYYDGVVGWKYLGFILNVTTGQPSHRAMFPFFLEQERSFDAFATGYYGLDQTGILYTTQPAKTTSALDVNAQSGAVYPVQFLTGN